MKKLTVLLVALMVLLCSCGPSLREDGQFGSEEFVGKFRGTSIYMVRTPRGDRLYLGVTEDGDVVSTQYSTGGKTPTTIRLIMIDGKEVTKEEALELLIKENEKE